MGTFQDFTPEQEAAYKKATMEWEREHLTQSREEWEKWFDEHNKDVVVLSGDAAREFLRNPLK